MRPSALTATTTPATPVIAPATPPPHHPTRRIRVWGRQPGPWLTGEGLRKGPWPNHCLPWSVTLTRFLQHTTPVSRARRPCCSPSANHVSCSSPHSSNRPSRPPLPHRLRGLTPPPSTLISTLFVSSQGPCVYPACSLHPRHDQNAAALKCLTITECDTWRVSRTALETTSTTRRPDTIYSYAREPIEAELETRRHYSGCPPRAAMPPPSAQGWEVATPLSLTCAFTLASHARAATNQLAKCSGINSTEIRLFCDPVCLGAVE